MGYKKIILIIIVAAAIFLDRLDITIVNIALPSLAHTFNTPVTQLAWVSNSFLIALACFIPLSGWVGERYGLKKTFIFSIVFFAIGTLLCSLSFNLSSIIVARFIQGIGGGMIVPIGMTLLYKSFNHEEYASVTGFIYIPILIAPAISPFIGAVIIQFLTWHWIFLTALPVCAVIIFAAYFFIEPDVSNQAMKKPCDQIGILLTSGFLIGVQLLLSEIGKNGFTINAILIFAVTCGLFCGWCRHESGTAYPLIKLTYFKNKSFLSANLLQLIFYGSHYGSFFLIGIYLQIGLGFSAISTGVILGVHAIGSLSTNRLSVSLYKKHGIRMPLVIGFVGIGLFSYAILFFIRDNSDVMFFTGIIILFLRGIFGGLCAVPIQTLSVITFEKHQMAEVNAIFNTCRQISISFGIALFSLFISYGAKISNSNLTNYHQSYAIVQSTFHDAFLLIPIFCIFGILINALMYKL